MNVVATSQADPTTVSPNSSAEALAQAPTPGENRATKNYRLIPGVGLTIRGIVVVCIGLYFLLGPVAQGSDIVAAVVGMSAVILMAVLTLITVITGARMTRKSRFDLSLRSHDHVIAAVTFTAQEPATLFLELAGVRVLPGFTVSVSPEFPGSYSPHRTVVLRGSSTQGTKIPFTLTFPHRGFWHLVSFRIVLKDILGLTSISWRQAPSGPTEIPVEPPQAIPHQYPISGYSGRPGDASHQGGERIGDPYDLKTYAPSDGVRRIAWKLFAKSNELHVRQPEPSVTPEGTVVSFALALDRDDLLARRVTQFHDQVRAAELLMLSGALGMKDQPIATTSSQTLELLMESTFFANQAAQNDLGTAVLTFIERCKKEHLVDIREVLLWCSDRLLTSRTGVVQALTQVGQGLQQAGIQPTFFLSKTSEFSWRTNPPSFFRRWFFSLHTLEDPTAVANGSAERAQLLETCQRSGWKVAIDE